MEVSTTLKFKTKVKKEEFKKFASQNEIKRVRKTYYYRDVKIVLDGSEVRITSSLADLLSCAFISKKVLSRFDGLYKCSPELSLYMPPHLLEKE